MMKLKVSLAGIFSVLLAFGLVLAGCSDDSGGDTWPAVTSLSQLDGTWKGSYSQTMTIKEAMEQDGSWDGSYETILGNMSVTASVEITQTINATAATASVIMKITQTYSGGNINTVWTFLKATYDGVEGVTADDANHSIIMTQTTPSSPISLDDMAGAQINPSGTKIKVPAGTMGEGSPAITLDKQ